MLGRLSRSIAVGEGETVQVLSVDAALAVRPGNRLVRRLADRRWEVADLGAGRATEIELDADGSPVRGRRRLAPRGLKPDLVVDGPWTSEAIRAADREARGKASGRVVERSTIFVSARRGRRNGAQATPVLESVARTRTSVPSCVFE
jgi:hypothetical protein